MTGIPALPVGSVVLVGDPTNRRAAVMTDRGWLQVHDGEPVPVEDWRAGWTLAGPSPAVMTAAVVLEGWDGADRHGQAARECLGRIAGRPGTDHVAAMAQAHASLAVAAEIRDLRALLVQAVDDLREAVEAVELGVRDEDDA